MKAKVNLRYKVINQIKKDSIDALVKTADALKTDLIKSQTMPFDTGELQNRNTKVIKKYKNQGIVIISSDTPYARRLYFHPEYHFHQQPWTSVEKGKTVNHGANAHAGGLWFQPYIDGNKKAFVKNTYVRFMRSKYK